MRFVLGVAQDEQQPCHCSCYRIEENVSQHIVSSIAR